MVINSREISRIWGDNFPKVVAWVNFISVLVILISSIWTYSQVSGLIQSADQQKQIAIINTLSGSVVDKILDKDYGGLENSLRLFMSDRSIASAVVTDTEGNPFVYLKRTGQGSDSHLFILNKKIPLPDKPDSFYIEGANGIRSVWKEISVGVPVGWVRLEFTSELSQKISTSLVRNIVFIALLIVVVLMMLSTLFFLRNHLNLRKQNEHLIKKEHESSLEVIHSHVAMMDSLGHAIAKRDSDTGAHNYRVTYLAMELGERLDVEHKEMQKLIIGSFLHDIGKVGIPDAILLKEGGLTEQEMAIMKTHVQHGVDMVRGMGWLDGAHEVVAHHHEKWEGTGYPRGLAGEEIPLVARIFSVVDVFDALSSKRPYKEAFSLEEVIVIMENEAGMHFDPMVLEVFLDIVEIVYRDIQFLEEAEVAELTSAKVKRYFYHDLI